ncbi:serine hydrolase [Brevundimonas sp.]|uniref:serine hydrolase domain-containing protein n=1 Tax=Brevundimonas sp. TaxID=1871086 RepID=UPI0028999821|nr:serine hydrolase [Brevundimonas sp.]
MRRLGRLIASIVLLAALAAPVAAQTTNLPPLERASQVLFWSQAEREAGFRAMDRIVPHRVIAAGDVARPLPEGDPLSLDVEGFMASEKVAGLLVLQDGQIRLERYGLDFEREGRWTSFSVAKSLTSTLVGAAIKDGYIASLETPIVRYLPELTDSAYEGVTVRQLLTMTSGADWNEDYTNPDADVARFFEPHDTGGMDPTLHYMRQLKRAAEPGTRWHYSTGETQLIGVLVRRATGKPLADYLSEKLWSAYGMERDAGWMIDESGQEASGCCVMASLRDWGRVGQFMLDGGKVGNSAILPDGWLSQATSKQADYGEAGEGYGFQWWTYDDGRYAAHGIFGQSITIDPERKTVVVILSAWPTATGRSAAREAFLKQVADAVDSTPQTVR